MPKDPNKPKRGLSAFMFYSKERRLTLAKEQPNLPFGDVAKTIGGEWKVMSDAKKKPYEAKAVKDRARYAKAMKTYVPPPDTGKRKKKKKKDPRAPKRSRSSYMFFAQHRRPQLVAAHPNWAFGDYGKKIGEEWRTISDSKKAKFEKQAAEDKIRYQNQLRKYQASMEVA